MNLEEAPRKCCRNCKIRFFILILAIIGIIVGLKLKEKFENVPYECSAEMMSDQQELFQYLYQSKSYLTYQYGYKFNPCYFESDYSLFGYFYMKTWINPSEVDTYWTYAPSSMMAPKKYLQQINPKFHTTYYVTEFSKDQRNGFRREWNASNYDPDPNCCFKYMWYNESFSVNASMVRNSKCLTVRSEPINMCTDNENCIGNRTCKFMYREQLVNDFMKKEPTKFPNAKSVPTNQTLCTGDPECY